MRYFNTAGPCDPEFHYMVPAGQRLPGAQKYINRGQYFVVHAPRQTGKTTSIKALAGRLNTEGRFVAVHFSCELGKSFRDDFSGAEQLILDRIRKVIPGQGIPVTCIPPDPWPDAAPGSKLVTALTAWTVECPKPIVLFFDEIDALQGETLRNVLSQLRDGYTQDRRRFVHSVVLCGLRDVRDYKAASGGDPSRLGSASPFNIKVDSIRIGNFTADEIGDLYRQHTAETGQEFTDDAIQRALEYTQGQPWLVNALAEEIIEADKMGIASAIGVEHIDAAKEKLISARRTHLDSLASTLGEPRVQRVIEPLIAGTLPDDNGNTYDDDESYVRDLGLIARDWPVRVANPIYREVIVRVLGSSTERIIVAEPKSFKLADGRLDFPRLLEGFATFWIENGEWLAARSAYSEAAAQLVMMAYLHRIVNGAGCISREYSVGSGRIDLLIRQPYRANDGTIAWQCEALELKMWRTQESDPLAKGLEQLDAYLDRLDLPTGVLVIFDCRDTAAPITERTVFSRAKTLSDRTITLLRA